MSDTAHQTVVKISGSFGADRTDYISRSKVGDNEIVKDETARKSRFIFSRQKNDFLRGAARSYLEGDFPNNTVREIIVGSRIFIELGADAFEREFALRGAVRDSMKKLLVTLGHERAPWVASIHRNTDHPHVHILIAENYKDKQGNAKSLPRDFPKELFAINEQSETAVSSLFKSDIQKRIVGLPPVEDVVSFAQESAGEDGFVTGDDSGKDDFSDLSKTKFNKFSARQNREVLNQNFLFSLFP